MSGVLPSQREYRTVILGALLRDVGLYLPTGEFGGGMARPQSQLETNSISLGKDQFARCVDADLFQTLMHRCNESPGGDPLGLDGISDGRTRVLARLVSRADSLASSERAKKTSGDQAIPTRSLAPVFERVRLLRGEGPAQTHLAYAQLRDLDSEPLIFPNPGTQTTAQQVTAHLLEFARAWNQLRERINWDSFEGVYAHCLSLLQRFASCIPSDTQCDSPDVPLFDHLRVTSAIAACLYRYHAATDTFTDEALNHPPEERCALLVGDLSGIQDYLFDIATVGAGGVARRLRARSFFLQMLAEAACLGVLRIFGLPLANVLMASGGKFYALLPNLPDTPAAVDKLQTDYDRWLLTTFHGSLALNLAWTPIAESELGAGQPGGGFGDCLTRLHVHLARRKQLRLERVLTDQGRWTEDAFVREAFPAETSVCRACGRFAAEHASERDGELDVCSKCYQDVNLGRVLPGGRFVGFYDRTVSGGTRCFDQTFVVSEALDRLPPRPLVVTQLNDADLLPLADVPATYRFLANHVPREPDGTPWTFEDIAAQRKLSEGESPRGLLAVIKADVDYLGQVFRDGLRRDKPPCYDTPSRIAALSRQLDSFFTAWLEWLLRSEFPHVYAVYSGGDDLLLVAPRNRALLLVKRLHEDLTRYTASGRSRGQTNMRTDS